MMFKIFLAALLALSGLTGCRLVGPLPPVDLHAPGWTTREGQAVWRMNRHATELAGEVLYARQADGRSFLQFSKGPFPVVMVQVTPQAWEISVPTENRRYSGPGRPPRGRLWFALLEVLASRPAPTGWVWSPSPDHTWRLEKPASGEYLEGFFNP